jgi:hypothetical protein
MAAEDMSTFFFGLIPQLHLCTLILPLLQTLRETCNTAKYEQIMDKIAGRLGPQYTTDRLVQWILTGNISSV